MGFRATDTALTSSCREVHALYHARHGHWYRHPLQSEVIRIVGHDGEVTEFAGDNFKWPGHLANGSSSTTTVRTAADACGPNRPRSTSSVST